MPDKDDQKSRFLKENGTFNSHAEIVGDPLFHDSEFFDPRDLVQVKYEMLRRVQAEQVAVTQAAQRFGFSRSGFYKTLAAFAGRGLAGLIPSVPGPRGAHKLTDEVLQFVEQQIMAADDLSTSQLVDLIFERFDLRVHPRSVERALSRREKKRR